MKNNRLCIEVLERRHLLTTVVQEGATDSTPDEPLQIRGDTDYVLRGVLQPLASGCNDIDYFTLDVPDSSTISVTMRMVEGNHNAWEHFKIRLHRTRGADLAGTNGIGGWSFGPFRGQADIFGSGTYELLIGSGDWPRTQCTPVSYSGTITIEPFDFGIKALSFFDEDAGFTPIWTDDGREVYDASSRPHWQDRDLDRTADYPPLPVSYAAESRPRMSLMTNLPPTFESNEGRIRGVSEYEGTEYEIESESIAQTTDGHTIDAVFSVPLPETVDRLENLAIRWEFSYDASDTWHLLGETSHDVYVTRVRPIVDKLHHTLIDVATRNVKGVTSAPEILAKTWSEFTDLLVLRKGVSVVGPASPLKYWGRGVESNDSTTEILLKNGAANCIAWSKFFLDALAVNGILGGELVKVQPTFSTDALLINDWTFSPNPKILSEAFPHATTEYRYAKGVFEDLRTRRLLERFEEFQDGDGRPGQANDDPPGAFESHHLVFINGAFYDPSYGTGPFLRFEDWALASIAGLVTPTVEQTISELTIGRDVDRNGIIGDLVRFRGLLALKYDGRGVIHSSRTYSSGIDLVPSLSVPIIAAAVDVFFDLVDSDKEEVYECKNDDRNLVDLHRRNRYAYVP